MRGIVIVGIMLMALGVWCGSVEGRPPDGEDISYIAARGGSYRATISCDSGEETLRLWVTLPAIAGEGEVLAIPADAPDVSARFEQGPVVWHGWRPSEVLHVQTMPMTFLVQCTQIYPLLWARFTPQLSYSAPLAAPVDAEGFGLKCRLATARSPAELREAVDAFDLRVDAARLNTLASFTDGKHSFAMIRVLDPAAYPHEGDPESPVWFCDHPAAILALRFPAKAPLLPARSPASMDVQENVDVAVRGFHAPNLSDTTWHHVNYYEGPTELLTVNAAHIGSREIVEPDVLYTRLECTCERPMDILFAGGPPWRPRLDEAAIAVTSPWRLGWPLAFLWLGLLSYVSGGAAGLITYRRWRGFGRVGLWNFLTLIAVWIRVGRGVNGIDSRKHATAYTVFFSGTFMFLYTLSAWFVAWIFSGRAF